MNIGVIFAGGVGTRMKTSGLPKQFLKVNGKPIIIHTLEYFQNNKNIDAIVLASVESHLDYCRELADKFGITKLKRIVPGGHNGQSSIYNALCAANEISVSDEDIVLIHDGVRPLITDQLLNDNIECVKRNGSAITCVECKETIAVEDEATHTIASTVERSTARLARAPQSFYLKDIMEIHNKALEDGNTNAIDSCSLMRMYGKELSIVIGSSENIKITTPDDFYVFKAILEAKQNSDIFGC